MSKEFLWNKRLSLTAVLAVSMVLDASASCWESGPVLSRIEGKGLAEVMKNLSAQKKKDIRTWDNEFRKVKVGRTTEKDILARFGYSHMQRFSDSHGAMIDSYDFPVGSESLGSLISETRISYFATYKFTINAATKIVENKEKWIYSVEDPEHPTHCMT